MASRVLREATQRRFEGEARRRRCRDQSAKMVKLSIVCPATFSKYACASSDAVDVGR
jgi:hypothetical protein